MTTSQGETDYLWRNISELPYFRGLLRAVEARTYCDIPLPGPVLDLGCGDGHFASVAFKEKLDVGLDPWTGPVHLAQKRQSYRLAIQGSGDRMPFADGFFNSAVSNSVLEHIPELDPVLNEMARVLKSGASFVFCVPNHQFLPNLSIAKFFDKIGLHGLAQAYRRFFNFISRHKHCDPPEVWEARLAKAGFKVERYWHYFSPQALAILEWGHYFGLPSLVSHWLFRRWILVPTPWNLSLTKKIVGKYYSEAQEQPNGAYSFYIARRVS